jgi:iron complex outermembrane receptor protein
MTDDLRVSSLSAKYDFGFATFISDTSYLDRTSTAVEDITELLEVAFGGTPPVPGLQNWKGYNLDISYTHAWQQELRLTSNDPHAPITWTTGLYYRTASQGLQQLEGQDLLPLNPLILAATGYPYSVVFPNPDFVYNGQALSGYGFSRAEDISEAAFADVGWAITSSLKLDLGVRYEHVVVEHQVNFDAGPLDGATAQNTLPDASSNPITPKASLTYQFTDTSMVYASAAKGFRPGGGNLVFTGDPQCQAALHALGLTQSPQSFAPDNLWTYEVGTKDRFFDRRLSIDGSVYYTRWTDIQTSVGLNDGCNNQYIANAGKAISQGFDLQLSGVILDGLTATANVGYTHAYYPGTLLVYAPTPGQPPPGIIEAAGDRITGISPWTANVNAQYTIDVGKLWADAKTYLRADYRWLDANPRPDPRDANANLVTIPYQAPSYGILNLRLGVTHGGLDLSAYVNNATHARPLLGYTDVVPNSTVFYTATTIRPLTAGVTAWYRF